MLSGDLKSALAVFFILAIVRSVLAAMPSRLWALLVPRIIRAAMLTEFAAGTGTMIPGLAVVFAGAFVMDRTEMF